MVHDGSRDLAEWLCLGVIADAHGVTGEVRIRCFTEQRAGVGAYGAVTLDGENHARDITVVRTVKGGVIARLEGITECDQALALKGREFSVPRVALPPPETEQYYHADLIGLRVRDKQSHEVGTVVDVYDFGAGDLLEITLNGDGKTMITPFTRDRVPEVDIDAGYITIGRFDDLI